MKKILILLQLTILLTFANSGKLNKQPLDLTKPELYDVMNNKIFACFAAIPLLAVYLFSLNFSDRILPVQTSIDKAEHNVKLSAKPTRTPILDPTPEAPYPPPEYLRVRQPHPGLIAGGIILLAIILFGVLRYARQV